MKLVLQRVTQASVTVGETIVGSIGYGILILCGIHHSDTTHNADILAHKCVDLRIFSDSDGKMNKSLRDIQGELLVVSQFTLYADCSKGRRPSYINAADPLKGKHIYDYFTQKLISLGFSVKTGIFGAMMDVALVNDGPVTIIIESNQVPDVG